mmetsp:Transcript_36542/g.90973  ORF Transcript_36542/g.90973 Transcript_36542/m.90973 type:complete len:108 (-) Transcript_36542:138-461(-)
MGRMAIPVSSFLRQGVWKAYHCNKRQPDPLQSCVLWLRTFPSFFYAHSRKVRVSMIKSKVKDQLCLQTVTKQIFAVFCIRLDPLAMEALKLRRRMQQCIMHAIHTIC